MKKAGIVTINDFNNYGNRLQCYALQEALKKINVKPENIYNDNFSIRIRLKKIKNIIIKTILNYDNQNNVNRRRKAFKNFNKNICFSKYKIHCSKIKKDFSNEYDFFVTGSDQVWNLNLKSISDIDFLHFAPDKKKNSYAASLGVSEVDDAKKDYYKKMLSNYNSISVREDAGKKIIEDITLRKDVEVLLDPTMLLNDKDWDKVAKKPKALNNQKYILIYFLGELSEERKKEISKFAKEMDCKIINVLDKNSVFYGTGPSEFLYLEKNAELICTDSFHSSVFAILYKTPFLIFRREGGNLNMNSRLDTLLSKFELKDRVYKGKITKDMISLDYSNAYRILTKEREKSFEFMKSWIV